MTANPTAMPMTSRRIRRMSRMIPKYSSAGIWEVFQLRPHASHFQVSPYATCFISPQSQAIVIGGARTRSILCRSLQSSVRGGTFRPPSKRLQSLVPEGGLRG
jgi:hypothetical protein